jgi:YtkA-like
VPLVSGPRPFDRARAHILGAAVAVTLAGAGCGTGSGQPTDVPLSFPEAALVTMASDSGALVLEMRSSPQPPVRGQDAAELRFTDSAGAPVDGLTLTVVPWMPAHGHGTSVQPVVTEEGPGVFIVQPLYLYMAGQWELRTTIAGAMTDAIAPAVDVP